MSKKPLGPRKLASEFLHQVNKLLSIRGHVYTPLHGDRSEFRADLLCVCGSQDFRLFRQHKEWGEICYCCTCTSRRRVEDFKLNFLGKTVFEQLEPVLTISVSDILTNSPHPPQLTTPVNHIYVFFRESIPLYVGKTTLRATKRLKEHIQLGRNDCLNQQLETHQDQIAIMLYEAPEDCRLDVLERGAFLALRPICNGVVPDLEGEYLSQWCSNKRCLEYW